MNTSNYPAAPESGNEESGNEESGNEGSVKEGSGDVSNIRPDTKTGPEKDKVSTYSKTVHSPDYGANRNSGHTSDRHTGSCQKGKCKTGQIREPATKPVGKTNDPHTTNGLNATQQQFVLRFCRQLASVIQACEHSESAEIEVGRRQIGTRSIKVKLLSERE